MQATIPSRRAVLVTLSLAHVGDRVAISGVEPDHATVRLATAMRRAGIAAQLHASRGPRTLRGLARGVAVRDPDAILVRVVDDTLLEFASAWIGAFRTECPDARIVLLTDDISGEVELAVDACVSFEDHASVLRLLEPDPADRVRTRLGGRCGGAVRGRTGTPMGASVGAPVGAVGAQ